ncbi:hypothetical protein Taro_006685 [Colocasia esculenta]|uniref:Uncharacterized protein n=1 Tax=Colocasia esculenta TaxID=4460 RepID=A0A843U1H0_COLES|nr:hypothetical protein [Colocasia esculenta]
MAALILITLAAVIVVPLSFYLQLWKPRKEEEAMGEGAAPLPPGPRGLPLLGHLPFLGPDLHHCFAELARSHGPVMSLRIGSKLCVVLSSPAAAREALKDKDAVFANHVTPAVVLASALANDMVWAPHGPVWRMLRKMSVQEVLSPAIIDGLRTVRRHEVLRMVEEVRRRVGKPVNVRELAFTTQMNVMTTMLWGSTLEEALGEELREVIGAMIDLLAVPNVSDFFPAVAWLDLQCLARRMVRLWARLDHIFDPVIEERRLRTVEGVGEASREGNTRSRDFLQDMVAGGTDTTSSTVELAMAQLLCNPQMMKKAKEEIEAVVGDDGIVEESPHLPRLHYLEAVVKEVLRLHPVVPLLLPRRPSSTCTIAGYRIPEGTKVFINVWAIHRDPQFWEDAAEFKPERFLSGGSHNSDNTGNDFSYLPFGGGRRICVGMPLAKRMVMLLLASLLHSVEYWTLPEGVQVDLSEKFGFVIKMKEPLVAVPMLP